MAPGKAQLALDQQLAPLSPHATKIDAHDQDDPHVLILPFPAQGHIIPALQLAHRLLSLRIIPTFIYPQHREHLLPTSLTSTDVAMVALPDKVDEGNDRIMDAGEKSLVRSTQRFEDMRDAFLWLLTNSEHLRSLFDSRRQVLLISDFLLYWTGDVAAKLNIPMFVFFPSSAAALCVSMYLPSLIAQGRIPILSSDLGHAAGAAPCDIKFMEVPGLAKLLAPSDLITAFREDFPKEGREACVKACLLLRESTDIIVNSFLEMEQSCFHALQNDQRLNPNQTRIYSVAPLLLQQQDFNANNVNFSLELKQKPQEVSVNDEGEMVSGSYMLEFLDTQAPASVLYISFGSIAQLSPHQIHEIAHGLEKSGHPFLWVVRSLTEDQGVRSGATAPSDIGATAVLPDGFQTRTQGRGFITFTWAPQHLILCHPSTGGFLSHCGWNSTVESVCAGVPMLAFPQFGEQFVNAKVVVDELGIGVEVKRDEDGVAGREEIERVVNLLMGDGTKEGEVEEVVQRRKAREWRDAAKKASVGSSSRNLLSLRSRIMSSKRSAVGCTL